jgi:inorganic pyrophosphatase
MKSFKQLAIAFCLGLALQGAAAVKAEELAPGLKMVDDYTIVGEANFLTDIAPLNSDGTINVVVEIPTGTVAKWEVMEPDGALKWEFKNGAPRIVKYLGYPGNYGMLSQTLLSKERGGDGDPLDVLVLGESVPRGSVVKAKVIGVLKLLDGGEMDDKIVAVLASSPLAEVDTPEQMDQKFPGVLSIVKIWFESYKGPGELTSDGYRGPAEAFQVIDAAKADFK